MAPNRLSKDWDFIEIQFEKSAFYNMEWKYFGPRYGVHAPYYVTLASPKAQKFDDAIKRIVDAAEVARKLNADIVVARAGFYSKQAPEEAMERVVKGCEEILSVIDVPLGIETQPETAAPLERVARRAHRPRPAVGRARGEVREAAPPARAFDPVAAPHAGSGPRRPDSRHRQQTG